MKHIGTFIIRALAIAAVVLLVLGAWNPDYVLVTLALGAITIVTSFGYGLADGKDAGLLFVSGVWLLIEAALVDEARTGIKIATIVIAAMLLLTILLRLRWRHRQQQSRRQQEPPHPAN